jgi:hypothetical protein
MSTSETLRIATELDTVGYSLTTYADLGLPFDETLAEKITLASAGAEFSPAAADLTKHIEKQHMTMVQEEEVLSMGRLIVAPVVDALFVGSPSALSNWNLYALNRYESVGALGAHQDSVGSTVFVATLAGEREFYIHRIIDGPAQKYGEVIDSFTLSPGSIVVLDGHIDPAHSVACLQSPSVSAVFDVPDLLRP